MSSKFNTISANLSELHHDLSNVRHPEKHSQKDVIAWMLEEHPKEIYNLALDIAENGLSPIELTLAVKNDNGEGYTVIEGNRRLTALKLLSNPNLADNTKLAKKYTKVKEGASIPIPRKIPVVLAPSKEEAMWIIDRRHEGQDGGRGVVPWNAQQRARAQRTRNGHAGRYERALNVIDYAVESNLLGDSTADLKTTNFPITNLERLLADTAFIQHMGISFDNDQSLLLDVRPEAAAKGIRRVLQDIAGGLSVTDIKNASLRKKYIRRIREDLPKPEDILDKPTKATGSAAKAAGVSTTPEKKKARSKIDRKKRSYLIDSSISVSEKNTNSVYLELKNCDLNSHPLAATCLLRVLLDHSTTHYIEKNKISIATKGGRRATLTEKIRESAQHLYAEEKIATDHLKKIKTAVSGNGGIADPENLHLSLHSRHFISNKADLIDIWDGAYGAFIEAIWEALA